MSAADDLALVTKATAVNVVDGEKFVSGFSAASAGVSVVLQYFKPDFLAVFPTRRGPLAGVAFVNARHSSPNAGFAFDGQLVSS